MLRAGVVSRSGSKLFVKRLIIVGERLEAKTRVNLGRCLAPSSVGDQNHQKVHMYGIELMENVEHNEQSL